MHTSTSELNLHNSTDFLRKLLMHIVISLYLVINHFARHMSHIELKIRVTVASPTKAVIQSMY